MSDGPDPVWIQQRYLPFCRALRRWHRARALNVACFPREGPALIVGTHSPASYDSVLALSYITEHTGRMPRGLAHDAWFRTPGVGTTLRRMGAEPASPDAAERILARGELLGVMPGGAREAFRGPKERYQLRWEGRTGFARLAIKTGAPIYLGACPAADLAYRMMFPELSHALERRYGVLLPVFRGIGPTLISRPVRFTFLFEGPIDPGPKGEPTEARVEALFALVRARMTRLIAQGVELDGLPR